MTHAEQELRALGGPRMGRHTHRASRLLTLCMVGGTFAVLIWMKLRVVGGVPRTAYADPDLSPAPNASPAKHAPSGHPLSYQALPLAIPLADAAPISK